MLPLLLTLLQLGNCQDFLSLVAPFVGSAISATGGGSGVSLPGAAGMTGGGNPGAGMVQSLVSQFIPFGGTSETGENVGSAFPFQEYFNVGSAIHQQLTGSPIAIPAFNTPVQPASGPTAQPQAQMPIQPAQVNGPSTAGWLAPRSSNVGGTGDQQTDGPVIPRMPPLPPNRFLPPGYNGRALSHQEYRRPAKRRFLASEVVASVPYFGGPAASGVEFGKGVVQMLGEVTRYSDVHQQQDQDYGSVQKLMRAFFHALAGESDDAPLPQLQSIYDGTETGRNRPVSQDLFESDIVLTVDQLKGIVLAEKERRTGRSEQRRRKRKVITGAVYRWNANQPISYEFKSDDESWRTIIRSALNFWQSETCLRWAENGPGTDRVVFFKGSGCYSSVGRTGGRQQISIGYGCEDKGIVTHEVGHSLGFWHEQSRPDRDSYIQLKQEFIARGTEGNFVKRSTAESDDMGLPYDLGSVMHYGPNAFTIDWDHTTIETVDKNYRHTIGQRAGPSFIDVKQVNRLYCNDRCAGSILSCQNGGYPDPNNCLVCKCPPGLGGPTCSSVQPSDCGSELIAGPLWQHLIYKGSGRCYWRIKADDARIRIILDSVAFKCDPTCRSYVELKHNSDFQQTGFRSCCSEKELEIVSEQSEALVIVDAKELNREGSFSLRYIRDNGKPLPKPPPPIWIPGSENRLFRGMGPTGGKGGPIERFILNSIPQIRDPSRPVESIASIVTEFTLSQLLGATRDG